MVNNRDKLEIAIPDAPAGFDETKLTVKTENGKYCIYYNEKKTNVEIAVPTENSIQKTGNTVTIVLGDKTVSFTLSAGDVLKSLVFEPQAYLNGVEAMKAVVFLLTYGKLSLLTKPRLQPVKFGKKIQPKQ